MKFEEYLKTDRNRTHEFEDECIISNLHLASLPMSMRELKSREDAIEKADKPTKKKKLQEDYEKLVKGQKWLLEDCTGINKIKTVSLDRLKDCIDREKKSCDAYFYNPNDEDRKRNLLIEFKNVNRNKILEYMENEGKDGLWSKIIDSEALLNSCIEFEGYSGEELISNTHIMIVYGEKANTISAMRMNLPKRNIVDRGTDGRQRRAVRFERQKSKEYSKKETEEILKNFSEKVKRKKFASCPKGYFGVPIKEPDEDTSGKEDGCWYTLYSKKDFQEVVGDKNYFEGWNWGVYKEFL